MKNVYVMSLNKRSTQTGSQRFSAYLLTDNGLEIVWAKDSHNGKNAKDKPANMVYSTREQYPAFHFHLSGFGYSKLHEIGVDLAQYFQESVTVYELNGMGNPSPRHIIEIENERIHTIQVTARRWFNPREGNTYHSCDIWVNDDEKITVDYAYGYGDSYLETALSKLEEIGKVTDRKEKSYGKEGMKAYCKDRDITLTQNVYDVNRKKDL